jgi:hypothetical protein
MRVEILIASLFIIAPASAQRPSTLSMSCGEARAIVASHGAIVLSTGAHLYNRYVRAPGFCGLGNWAERATVPTADVRQCPVGYICQSDGLEMR